MNKYTEEEIDNAVQLMNNVPVRPENMEYGLFVQARKQMNLTNKLNKMGGFHHVSAQLIPKLGQDGKMKVPVEWIGKTKGDTYENLDKQKQRKMELFGYYMSNDRKEDAQRIVDSMEVLDKKIYLESPEYKRQVQEQMEAEKAKTEAMKPVKTLKARSRGK